MTNITYHVHDWIFPKEIKHWIIPNHSEHCDRYDLVDLTRQVLSKLANQVYADAVIAYQGRDVKAYSLHSQNFVQLIKDIDVLLASDDNFLLGTWLESAKKLAANPTERRQVRTNLSLSGLLLFAYESFLEGNITLSAINFDISAWCNNTFK